MFLAGKKVVVAAVVKQTINNRLYLHEVLDENGNAVYIKNEEVGTFKTTASDKTADSGVATSSNNNISQILQDNNGYILQWAAKEAPERTPERLALEKQVQEQVGIDTRTEVEKRD